MLTVGLVGGCSTPYTGQPSVTYTYEPRFDFAPVKTYRWAESNVPAGDPLLESNVRYQADGVLATKGLAPSAERPDVIVSIRYEYAYGYSYGLRSLVLQISRADDNALVWRGIATGAIRTDAASGDLKTAVDGMLANFPPAAAK